MGVLIVDPDVNDEPDELDDEDSLEVPNDEVIFDPPQEQPQEEGEE